MRRTTGVVMVVMLGCALSVRAEESEARRHFDRGVKAYNLQEFRVALDEFRAAYVERPDPAYLFNIGQAQRNLGQYEAAAKSYRAYLNTAAPSPSTRTSLDQLVHQMEDAAKSARASVPPTGTEQPAAVVARPVAVVTTPAPARRPWYHSPAGMTLSTVGFAGAVTGAALLGYGASLDASARSATTLPNQMSLHADAGNMTTAGAVTLGIGGGALVVGAILLAVQR